MSTHYLELSLDCPEGYAEILVAELAEAGFESFSALEERPFRAYVSEEQYPRLATEEILGRYESAGVHDLGLMRFPIVNWNEKWEENYDPVEALPGRLRIRAPFHEPDPQVERELVIMPKMSFGTGHHPTTLLLLKWLHELDFSGQNVLDMGCGTGILGIMAEQQGARQVLGLDNFDWAAENSQENAQLNGATRCQFATGSLAEIPTDQPFDTILANINLSVLQEQLPAYRSYLRPGGQVFLSGVMRHDRNQLAQIADAAGYRWQEERNQGEWVAALVRY